MSVESAYSVVKIPRLLCMLRAYGKDFPPIFSSKETLCELCSLMFKIRSSELLCVFCALLRQKIPSLPLHASLLYSFSPGFLIKFHGIGLLRLGAKCYA